MKSRKNLSVYVTHGHDGHKRPGGEDSPKIVEETRQYIRDLDRIAAATTTAEELYTRMVALYPDRLNPGALWSSTRGVMG